MSDKFLHELPELTDTRFDDLLLVSRAEVENKMQRATLFAGQGTGLDYGISTPIAVPAGGLVPVAGVGLVGSDDFDGGVFDLDLGLFTAPFAGLFAFELEVLGTSVTAAGAGPLSLQGLAAAGDRLIASQVVAAAYGTSGANSLWQGRFFSIAFLDAAEDFYFGVSRLGAPAFSVTGGRIRITKMA